MIKTLRIKVALELDSGNGEELSKFSSELKKKREKSLLPVKMTIFFFWKNLTGKHILKKKSFPRKHNTYLINFPYVL